MKIKFGELILNESNIDSEEYKYSNLYDAKLHSFNTTIQVKGSSLDEFKDLLEKCFDGGAYRIDENNEVISEYKVKSNCNSYSGSITDENTIYNYSLTFEEVVNRNIKSLNIDRLDVVPYVYDEEYDDAIIIRAKIQLTEEEMEIFKSIEDNKGYFDVIRNGISNKIIKMRFGTNIWSENNGTFKVNIVLVEESYDSNEEKSYGLFQPEMKNMMNMLAYQINLNNKLISTLLDKNVLTEKDVDDIKSKSEKEINESYRLFYKVKDVDTFR